CDPKAPLAAGANPVLLHQPLHTLLAHTNALSPKLPPDARPAVGSPVFCIGRTDVCQQCFVAQMAASGYLPAPRQVLVISGYAYAEHTALHPDRPDPLVVLNKGILHFWPFAKNAVAFPRMSRSIVTRANSARKRLISICSAVTALFPMTPFSLPARCNFTQLARVCSTTPRLRAAAAIVWPDSTSRTASSLNSSVYLLRFPFLIVVSLSLLKQLAKGYVLRGQGHQTTQLKLRKAALGLKGCRFLLVRIFSEPT